MIHMIQLTAYLCQNVNAVTDLDYGNIDDAYGAIGVFNELGFDVEAPVTRDGISFTVRVYRPQ